MYQLFCDSNCELWYTTVAELGLNVIRMPYTIGDKEYFYDMGEKMAAADLVMCRAGASSLAEVCCQAKPSVIVPSPYVTDNHQEKNARVLEKNGAAKVILEKSTDGKEMYETVKKLIFDGAALSEMSKNAAKMAVTDGTDKIYKEILRLISLG